MALSEPENKWELNSQEELQLHQLQARQYWADKVKEESDADQVSDVYQHISSDSLVAIPPKWSLLGGLTLYDWQRDCINSWFAADKRGTVKVVTGAGKTVLALGLMEQLQNQIQPDLRVAVVVPTIVLMNQWYEEFIERGNLPSRAIGRLGGGYQEDFSHARCVLLCVLNSAQAKLSDIVAQAGYGQQLLLVVDECHRAGGAVMSNIFKTKRVYNLGLSATPERDDMADDEDNDSEQTVGSSKEQAYNESLLGQQLGPIVYYLTVEEAFKRGILPPYEIAHYGLPLTAGEQQRYERLTRSIHDARQNLSGIALARGVSGNGAFNRWCRAVAQKGDELGRLAGRYIGDIARRKTLLYGAEARRKAVITLLKQELEENADARAILFHESIDEAMALWHDLVQAGLPAVPENSQLTNPLREASLDMFRRGVGRILVSVRSLVEGFNVPATDIGLIVASNTSVRQRIQTIGRVLRKHRTRSGEEKHALIQVLYMDQTVDDLLYAKTDWDRITGAERNTYYKWDSIEGTPPVEQLGPPRRPLPADIEVDISQLQSGNVYPGAYEGTEYTADTSGNVYLAGNKEQFARNPQGIPAQIKQVKGSFGRFRVTPNKGYVLVIVPQGDDWVTLFVMSLNEPFEFQATGEQDQQPVDTTKLKPGDEFTGMVDKDALTYNYKQVRGRKVITRKVGRDEIYARTSQTARNPANGRAAEHLLEALATVEQTIGFKVATFVLTKDGHALFSRQGKWYFIVTISDSLEFLDER